MKKDKGFNGGWVLVIISIVVFLMLAACSKELVDPIGPFKVIHNVDTGAEYGMFNLDNGAKGVVRRNLDKTSHWVLVYDYGHYMKINDVIIYRILTSQYKYVDREYTLPN